MAHRASDIIVAPLFLECCKCFYGQSVTQPPHQSIGRRHILHNYPALKYVRSFTNFTYISPLLMASNCHPHMYSFSLSLTLTLSLSLSAYFFHSSQFREYINLSSANSYRSHIHSALCTLGLSLSLCFFFLSWFAFEWADCSSETGDIWIYKFTATDASSQVNGHIFTIDIIETSEFNFHYLLICPARDTQSCQNYMYTGEKFKSTRVFFTTSTLFNKIQMYDEKVFSLSVENSFVINSLSESVLSTTLSGQVCVLPLEKFVTRVHFSFHFDFNDLSMLLVDTWTPSLLHQLRGEVNTKLYTFLLDFASFSVSLDMSASADEGQEKIDSTPCVQLVMWLNWPSTHGDTVSDSSNKLLIFARSMLWGWTLRQIFFSDSICLVDFDLTEGEEKEQETVAIQMAREKVWDLLSEHGFSSFLCFLRV